ncbi:phosphatidylserine decarboxylase-domain-containing protein [Jimgerdemannia flammicorona]|uniref:Phosphatidylserine decarboxylase proenzyme 1, mitochondrial n=1 Tax=Jimgerdemannia flammicorona TaxID=994334 RepID=A0A433R0I3_9FUNG|nr:phosphatidylserine decarboxylase-domain-containing protein [Jimgerdemannia flammicorona]
MFLSTHPPSSLRTFRHACSLVRPIINVQRLRPFHRSLARFNAEAGPKKPYSERLKNAWNATQVKWYPIPVGLGIAFIGFQHSRHIRKREWQRLREEAEAQAEAQGRPRVVVEGPWQVRVAAALPLRSLSRLWGWFNNLNIPRPLRIPGFKLYSFLFGCNLEEMKNPDLRTYSNLSEFFYRELKDGARPIENSPLVSPSDGKILHFGVVEGRNIEQIKGKTYSLDALIGGKSAGNTTDILASSQSANIVNEEKFANINDIPYSLDTLLGSDPAAGVKAESIVGPDGTVRTKGKLAADTTGNARAILKRTDLEPEVRDHHRPAEGHGLFFCVIYLAPGDYHRFHSPTNWVVEARRHFAGEFNKDVELHGELFSVSPYMVKLLENLFVLNERVVLNGRWQYGIFSMIPVGATNVGSIKINFDEALKTNRREDLPGGTYTEVSYRSADPFVGGKQLVPGEEMGGFCLGSTVVLVFEAPLGFRFGVQAGQKVRMGQALGEMTA